MRNTCTLWTSQSVQGAASTTTTTTTTTTADGKNSRSADPTLTAAVTAVGVNSSLSRFVHAYSGCAVAVRHFLFSFSHKVIFLHKVNPIASYGYNPLLGCFLHCYMTLFFFFIRLYPCTKIFQLKWNKLVVFLLLSRI